MESVFAQHLSCGSNVAMRSTVTALSICLDCSYRPVADGVGGPRDEVFHRTQPLIVCPGARDEAGRVL